MFAAFEPCSNMDSPESIPDQPAKRLRRFELIPPSQPDRLIHGREIGLYYTLHEAGTWTRHRRDEMEIVLFFTPAIARLSWLGAGGAWQHRDIQGEQVCVIAAGLVREFRLEGGAEMLILYVERSLVRRVAKEKVTGVAIAAAAQHDLFLWFIASALRQLCMERAAGDYWMIDGLGERLVRRLLSRLDSHHDTGMPPKPVLRTSDLEKVHRFMQANLKHDIHVIDFAKQTGHSEAHFSELFKARTQLSPYQYLKEIRLLKAYQMILTGDYLMREVALEVGYTNPDHFSELFHKRFHQSPSFLLARARLASAKSRRISVNCRESETRTVGRVG